MADQFISCPGCGRKIQLTEAFTRDIEERLRRDFESESKQQQKEHDAALKAQQKEFEEMLARERSALEKQAKKRAEESVTAELVDLRSQLSDKQEDAAKAQKREVALLKRVREAEEREKALELEVQRKIDAERNKIREQASKLAAEEHRLKDAEKEKQIADMRAQIEELKRKAEQGSQQAQGEVLELHLEAILSTSFPTDSLEPVPKGVRGADVLQRVRNELGEDCGTILWESKRTKNWSDGWLQKLKDDQREAKADLAAIVSVAMPEDITHIGEREQVWISDVPSAVGLAAALRQGLLHLAHARRALVGKNTKMDAIYNYLSGPEFRQRVEAIVESFVAMQQDLQAEKRAMEKVWAKREKQINKVIENTSRMYGDLEGMIGASLPEIKILELPSGERTT